MKVYVETLGCRLNESEIEAIARGFTQRGDQIVQDAGEADLCVVNTCAVTQDASKASRQRIRQMNRANPDAQIIVTGCYSQLAPKEVSALPGVVQIIDNQDKDRLVPIVMHERPDPMDDEAIRL